MISVGGRGLHCTQCLAESGPEIDLEQRIRRAVAAGWITWRNVGGLRPGEAYCTRCKAMKGFMHLNIEDHVQDLSLRVQSLLQSAEDGKVGHGEAMAGVSMVREIEDLERALKLRVAGAEIFFKSVEKK